jgi:hypothetical protein
MEEYIDEFVKYLKKAKDNDKILSDELRKILLRDDPYTKFAYKSDEEIYLLDNYDNVRIELKTVPILLMMEKKDEYFTITVSGKNNSNPLTKLKSEKSKYIFSQAFNLLDEAIKNLTKNKQNIWGNEVSINNDIYKYEAVKKSEKIQGFVVNKDNMTESYYLILMYILGKINEKGYFIRYDKDDIIFYITHDYKILPEGFKIIDGEIKQV